jgi:pyruvate/2-oxoglutarate dehydrogenase complex dihydrolipoamide dehydrogenase (E3) component
VTRSRAIAVTPLDAHDQALVRNVRPAGWTNPEPSGRYNLVVIGAGTAGLITAAGSAGLGARVALIERDRMGGDCLNAGCVPSKALIRAARAAAQVRDAGEFGVEVPAGARVDFPAVMERMRRLRASLSPADSAARYGQLGVDVHFGEARFTGPDAVEVGGRTLRFKRAVIATGARAAKPSIPGLEEMGYLTSETVFSLVALPARLAVIGAGPIGCELAQAFQRFGSRVTLIANHPRVLVKEDVEAAALVEKAMLRDGIEILRSARVLGARRESADRVLAVEADGRVQDLRADEVLVGVGRVPGVEGLGLEAAGVEYDSREGVAVDDRLRTTNPRIYAAGDICSRLQFTHAADATARLAIQNALFFGRARASRLIIPWCTYTDPEVAHVGLHEEEAGKRGIALDTFTQDLGEVDRAVLDGETAGYVKVHVRKGTDRIAGATIVAARAGDLISELTLAMTAGIGLGTLARTIHPYPTQAEAMKKVADAYNRTRLTPRLKALFTRWFAWRR